MFWSVVEVLAFLLIVAGAALLSWPLALIVLGLELLAASYVVNRKAGGGA